MPAPLIEFAQFAHPQRWWLRRGPPPWLDDPRWRARAFRVTLALGVMGTLSGWLTIGWLFLLGFVDGSVLRFADWGKELTWWYGPGLCFGVVVLVPLSRWLGRGWILTLLAIPASGLACYGGMTTFFFVSPILARGPDWIPGGKAAGGAYAAFAGAAIVSVWMGHPLRASAWLAGLAATLLASTYFLFGGVLNPGGNMGPLPNQVREFLNFGRIYVSFQCLTAIGLSVRLWWRDGGVRAGEKESVRE